MATTARIALLQLPAFSVEQAEESLEHTLRRIDETARDESPDLIALPEVTYPGYFLGRRDLRDCGVLSPSEAADRIAGKAREHRTYIAAGLALDAHGNEITHESPRYTNGALLFGRDGSVVGRYDKSFLWHFDTRWFAAGAAYPVFDTDFGRVGILVCADGRMPEIARCLSLTGAQVILDLTAWVSGGRQTEDLTTTQFEYLMRVRAVENGVWVACADKFGTEADSIVYAGRSCVIDPGGHVAAALEPDDDAALVFDVPIGDRTPPIIRRPELYGALTQPTDSLPVLRTLSEPVVPQDVERRVAVVQITMPPTGDGFLQLATEHVRRQALMDASIVLFPATPSRYRQDYRHDDVLVQTTALARETGVCIGFVVWEPDGDGYRTLFLVGPKGVLGSGRQTHKPPGEKFAGMPLGDQPSPVVMTPAGRVGLMLAADGYAPEVARSLMLRGAEIILWAGDDPGVPTLPVARTRAEENRVYVVCSGAPTVNGASAICDPSGRVLAVALEGRELAVGAEVNSAIAHIKERAPGTDVVRSRQPATYSMITAGGRNEA
jgi:predicted amidohydrolase